MTPIVFGGPKHLWSGKLVRCIRVDGNVHAVLSKQHAEVSVQIPLERNRRYLVSTCVKSAEPTSLTVSVFDGGNKISTSEIVVASPGFAVYECSFELAGIGSSSVNVILARGIDVTADVELKQITITENHALPLPKQSQPVKQQREAPPKAPEPVVEERALDNRNQAMTTIGGNGYTWRGKNLKPAYKDGVQCIELPNKASSLFAKAGLQSEEEYKVVITAKRTGGNGNLLVNIFGSVNTDGKHKQLTVQEGDFRDYTVVVPSPKFTPGATVYFRVWRNDASTGKIIIKTLKYSKIQKLKDKPVARTPARLPSDKQVSKSVAKTSVYRRRKPHTEEFNMIYKPYDTRAGFSDRVEAVFMRRPEDVPMVSIITPTRGGLELTTRCYNALVSNTGYPNWEWIVGDSCSEDGTVEWLKSKQDPRLKVIERGTTDGSFSSINNELVKHAGGEYLVFLNNDTEPQPFWLHNMLAKLHHNPELGVVGAKLLYPGGQIQHCGIAMTREGPANIGKDVLGAFPKGFAEQDRLYQAVTAACMMMRKSDFEALNGFDERYWFCYDDVDLCLRVIHELGKRVMYSSTAVVTHNESATQKRHRTSGDKQKMGIELFKKKWMSSVNIDFQQYMADGALNVYKTEISFVTCVSNVVQYMNYVAGSLLKNDTKCNYELIPVFNVGNKYSAASALNLGLSKAKGKLVVFCHQDVLFYKDWVNTLLKRVAEIDKVDKNWGIIGTAGITIKDATIGSVQSLKGKVQWQQTSRVTYGAVQTVDEHCMIMRRNSGLKFDEAMTGFHLYGPDICLSAMSKNLKNYGILNPLVHDSNSTSLASGKDEFMKWLNYIANKWGGQFRVIRTPTSKITGKTIHTYINF
jgi:GT2 family glycosyltransferase